jgi:hypothetical protein
MELSKDEPIFKLIDELKKNLKDNEVFVKFHNNIEWTETEFNNFINMMRNNYKETIEDEYLEVYNETNYLKIFKLSDILKYCNTNNHTHLNHKWEKRNVIKNEFINDLFDVNLEFNIHSISNLDEIANWNELEKKFKFIKKFNYDLKNGIQATAMILKTSDNLFTDLKKSKILTSQQRYEFQLSFNDTTNLLSNINIIIKSLFLSNVIITKKQQKIILEEYEKLVRQDMQLPHFYKDIPLLTPKPITLEQVNLVNPDDYGAISILKNYTVTEKADGERYLMYINNSGNVFLINSSLKVEDTGIKAKKEAYNSLIDGEYITCHKRTDGNKKNLFAAFDIYYLNNKSLTSISLMALNDKEISRNSEMIKIKSLLDISKSELDFIIKNHRYSDDIIKDCKYILSNPDMFPYDIDGLIFTPAKLAVLSFYPSVPVPISQNMGWDRLFKWKPPEQNTIDFLIRYMGDVKKDGIRYKKLGLYVGFNPITSKNLTIEEGLKLRYDRNYNKEQFIKQKEMMKNKEDFIPVLFKPIIYYHADVEFAFIRIDTKGEIRAENNDKIENDSIIEFRYDIETKEWIPIRVREDKTKIFRKGVFSKTANSLQVAINIWRSIHNPISKEIIIGSTQIKMRDIDEEIQGKELEADDIYYSRGIPRRSLLSYNMVSFHNLGIKESLYLKSKNRNSLLELACGQAGDMPRWINADFKFVLGVDFAKDNIYKANDGAYSRVVKEFAKFNKNKGIEKGYFFNSAFAAGDCSLDIRSGEAGVDDESRELLKIVMNISNKNMKAHYKYIAGKGANGFDAVTCMYAIHYFFESERKLEGFLNNVSSNLRKDGVFICTFMDGESVMRELNKSSSGLIEGRKTLDGSSFPLWAIIKRYINEDENYNKKVDIFIENTQRLIPEYLVNFSFLIEKAKDFGLELDETEMYAETFGKLRAKINEDENKQTSLDKIILELDKDEIQKRFSFFNRWAVFKKIS